VDKFFATQDWHGHVKQNDRGKLWLETFQCSRPVGRGLDLEAFGLKVRPNRPANIRVVVDDQDRSSPGWCLRDAGTGLICVSAGTGKTGTEAFA
jgi:hypothetical protein